MVKSMNRTAALAAWGLLALVAAPLARAAPVEFTVLLSGQQRVPPLVDQSASTSTASFTYDEETRALTWSLVYSGVRSAVTEAQLRGPAALGKNARVLIQLGAGARNGVQIPSPVTGHATLTPRQARYLIGGTVYVVVNTADHPDGELRAQVIVPKS